MHRQEGVTDMAEEKLSREEKARLARLEYQRAWRKKHQEKMREYAVNQWARKYDEMHSEEGERHDG